jgi:hypothetical protein
MRAGLIITFLLAILLSSCAIHRGKFPYICFRRGCVKAQLDIKGKLYAIKLNKNKRETKRRKRRGKAERENKVKDDIAYQPTPKETREERNDRRKKEKYLREKEEDRRSEIEDSLYTLRHIKKYVGVKTTAPAGKGDTLIIFFEPGSDSISVADEERIKAFVETNKSSKVKMTGSMDETESDIHKTLSARRLNHVALRFQQSGFSQGKISKIDNGAIDSKYASPQNTYRKVTVIIE